MSIKIYQYQKLSAKEKKRFFERSSADYEKIKQEILPMMKQIKEKGDSPVLAKYVKRSIPIKKLAVSDKEFDQAYLTNSIIAIGYLRQYLSSVMQMGQQAERDIFNAEKTREEILAEELN